MGKAEKFHDVNSWHLTIVSIEIFTVDLLGFSNLSVHNIILSLIQEILHLYLQYKHWLSSEILDFIVNIYTNIIYNIIKYI